MLHSVQHDRQTLKGLLIGSKLSERVALFLRVTPEERMEIFKTAKAAYNVRSKTVHGDTLSKKLVDDVPNIAMKCDNMLRETIKKILTNHSLFEIFIGPAQELEDYLNGLIFGVGDATVHETDTT